MVWKKSTGAVRLKTVAFNIYPNPASDMVNLNYDFPLEVKVAEVKIMNVLGSVVSEQNIDTRSNQASIDISNINDGIYFYTILINGEVYKIHKWKFKFT